MTNDQRDKVLLTEEEINLAYSIAGDRLIHHTPRITSEFEWGVLREKYNGEETAKAQARKILEELRKGVKLPRGRLHTNSVDLHHVYYNVLETFIARLEVELNEGQKTPDGK